MRTSYSSIQTYLQCPQKYKFQEIDRIKSPKSIEAIFGTLVHGSLKFMFSKDPLFPTFDEVVAHFRTALANAHAKRKTDATEVSGMRVWTDTEEKIYLQAGTAMLKNFYEKNAPWNFTIVDLESRFEVVLADEITGETHVLAGIIDRIDRLPDGNYEIIDYKTTKRMPSQDALNDDLQLSLYSLGLQKRWPHLTQEQIKLSLYFLKHGEKLTASPSPSIAERTKIHVLKTIAEIQDKARNNKPFEPMPGPLCNFCAFKPICPAWKHLYREKQTINVKAEMPPIEGVIDDYIETKDRIAREEERMESLQSQIKAYMAQEQMTRVFGVRGAISQKTIQRYDYDMEKIKSVLSPLGRWEEILKADMVRLKRIAKEMPINIRDAIDGARSVAKEYTVLHVSGIKNPPQKEADEAQES